MIRRNGVSKIWKRVAPGVEAVVLRVRDADDQGAFTEYNLTHARQEVQQIAETALSGNLVQDETTEWLIWADDLAAASAPTPKVGDEIEQTVSGSEVVWEITRVSTELFGDPVACACIRRAVGSA